MNFGGSVARDFLLHMRSHIADHLAVSPDLDPESLSLPGVKHSPGRDLNVREAARLLGKSAYTVRERLKVGALVGYKDGRDWRVPLEAVPTIGST